ncbi:MAG: hypothetical protein R2684_01215 [Pyrinomonadaceae bacterium]
MKRILVCVLFTLIGVLAASAQHGGVAARAYVLDMKGNSVLGGIESGKYLDAATVMKGYDSTTKYLGFLPSGRNGLEFSVDPKTEMDDICEGYYSFSKINGIKTGIALGGSFNWNPQPRKVTSMVTTLKVYNKIVRDYLKTKGVTIAKPKIEQLYKADLDGDGTDEVILRATDYKSFGASARKNEYSFVMVRKIVNKRVENFLVEGDFITNNLEFGAPNKHDVTGIADLNGDGKMEVVVYSEYYEGAGTAVYEINSSGPKMVLSNGCGV